MAKLNLVQIRYIDIELLKLDFKFVDIRYEMTDHIASVLEGIPALMLVLIISLYRCRKHYTGKYI